MKNIRLLFVFLAIHAGLFSQNNNGTIDMVEELAEKKTMPFVMPDGTKLMTDVYLPILQDSITIKIPLMGTDSMNIEVLPKGVQYVYYDSVNGNIADNPYELPVIFMRTPYSKSTETIGHAMAFLGYAVIMQDNRGTYASEGVYLPMYSDSWAKMPYHPSHKHTLDITTLDDPVNANNHEDGYNSISIINELEREYEGKSFSLSNGNVGMIGFSALGNVQYQLSSAHRIDPNAPGLKAIMPIVAANEHYRFTAVHNGVFREQLVTGWIRQMYRDVLDDSMMEADSSIMNSLHSASDYDVASKYEAAEKAIDHWMAIKTDGKFAGYYPNSILRADMDASYAPVDQHGEGQLNGGYNRYENMQVPGYHLTGWWDIFIDGQIETYNQIAAHVKDERIAGLQKLVIGPWAHQTITEVRTGDMTYPENVREFLFDPLSMDVRLERLPLEKLFGTELMDWFRYNLNYGDWKNVGLPKIIIPEAKEWQTISSMMSYKIPSKDYILTYMDFINFLSGKTSLENFPVSFKMMSMEQKDSIDVPPLEKPVLNLPAALQKPDVTNFMNVPNVRLYVVGPQNDGINEGAGNYWFAADSFPFNKNITYRNLYLSADGSVGNVKPVEEEAFLSYVYDPDNPVLTAGGANMITRTPETNRKNQGQMNLASDELKPVSMNRPDVLAFETSPLQDTLCVMGFPVATLYAKSLPLENYTDSTDTDFVVRILDVYPGGEAYFVVEGAVNARARNYARQIANGREDATIPFTNILSNEIYEFQFKMMPLAYTFGKGHKIKVLISSSNYPRYQSNPNLPLEPGEFFRREPNDGKTYNYKGMEMSPRKAEQTVYFAADQPSRIELPVYKNIIQDTPTVTRSISNQWKVKIYPNPAEDYLIISSNSTSLRYTVYNANGRAVAHSVAKSTGIVDVSSLPSGIYIIFIVDAEKGKSHNRKFIKK